MPEPGIFPQHGQHRPPRRAELAPRIASARSVALVNLRPSAVASMETMAQDRPRMKSRVPHTPQVKTVGPRLPLVVTLPRFNVADQLRRLPISAECHHGRDLQGLAVACRYSDSIHRRVISLCGMSPCPATEVAAKAARSPYSDRFEPQQRGFATLRSQFQLPAEVVGCNMTSPCRKTIDNCEIPRYDLIMGDGQSDLSEVNDYRIVRSFTRRAPQSPAD
jgi:hypothetical protein